MDLREIASAYQSIYLKEEEVVEENQIIFEDLSQEEVDDFTQEIIEELLEEGFDLDCIIEGFGDYIDEQSALLTEARAAKKARKGAKSYEQVKAEIDAKEPAKKAAREAKKPGGAIVKSKGSAITPAQKAGALVKPVTFKKKTESGESGQKSLPAGKKGGAIVKRNETIGPKAEVKDGVRKAATYRMSKADLKRANRRDVKSAEPKSVKDKVKDAASAVRVGARNLRKKAGKSLMGLAKKLSEEGGELDSFDTVVAYLLDEEIASDFTEAVQKMTKLSEETVSKIHAAQLQLLDEAYTVTNADKKGNTQAYKNYKAGMKGKDGKPLYKAADHMKEND